VALEAEVMVLVKGQHHKHYPNIKVVMDYNTPVVVVVVDLVEIIKGVDMVVQELLWFAMHLHPDKYFQNLIN
jgi:hypothetical protein